MVKTIFILVFLLFNSGSSSEREKATAILNEINNTYQNNAIFSKIQYSLTYPKSAENNDLIQGKVILDNNYLYSQLGPIEQLQNDKYLIFADSEQKQILIYNSEKNFRKEVVTTQYTDSLVKKQESLSLIENGENTKLNFIFNSNSVDNAILDVNNKLFLINSLTVFFKQTEEQESSILNIKFDYLDIKQTKKPIASDFAKIKSGKFVLTGQYLGFEVHDLRNKK